MAVSKGHNIIGWDLGMLEAGHDIKRLHRWFAQATCCRMAQSYSEESSFYIFWCQIQIQFCADFRGIIEWILYALKVLWVYFLMLQTMHHLELSSSYDNFCTCLSCLQYGYSDSGHNMRNVKPHDASWYLGTCSKFWRMTILPFSTTDCRVILFSELDLHAIVAISSRSQLPS